MNYDNDICARVDQIFEALDIWQKLRDIPINDEDEIEEDFMHFPSETDRFEIWHWIEDTYNVSVNTLQFYTNEMINLQ